jgi:hypothetical protein
MTVSDEAREALTKEARRIHEDCTYSSKGHYEAAARWDHAHLWLGIPSTILAAVSGVSALGDQKILAVATSVAVAILTALSTFLKPNERSAEHRQAGAAYLSLKNDARRFETIELQRVDPDYDASLALKVLGDRQNQLNEGSRQVPRWAFERARRGIEQGEARHAVDVPGARP